MEEKVRIVRINDKAVIPAYGTEDSAGADLYACLNEPVTIDPGCSHMFHIGVVIEIPKGYAGLVFARSGLASRKGLAPANKVGVIDSDYRGELMVPLFNQSDIPQTVEPGERIAQLVLVPYLRALWEEAGTVEELEITERGRGGFGSTGRK